MVGEAGSSAGPVAQGSLLPGLPDDLACLCLACIPLWQQARLKGVCRAWKDALSARFLFDLRARLGKQEEFLCVFWDDPALTQGELWDPRARVWRCLPPMPCDPYSYGLTNFECVAVGSALLVMGGSLFDARAFPLERPLASSTCFRLDSLTEEWRRVADMPTARGSFACAVCSGQVFVAGGGSRHAQFGAGGSRTTAVERYDVKEDQWHQVPGLSRIRAGCVGFFLHGRFFVMGGYGDSRTISGILPVDEFYSDGEVLDPASGTWQLLAPMWEEGERTRLGKVAVLDDSVFMLDGAAVFRYDVEDNRWCIVARLPDSMVLADGSRRLVALDGELYVIPGGPPLHTDGRKKGVIVFQVYNPRRRSWRLVHTRRFLAHSHRTSSSAPLGAICSIRL